jgi:hypothetical protein
LGHARYFIVFVFLSLALLLPARARVAPAPILLTKTNSARGIWVILRALKKYGMILTDNCSNWFISGAPDMRRNDDELNTLKGIKGSDFEVIKMTNIVTH